MEKITFIYTCAGHVMHPSGGVCDSEVRTEIRAGSLEEVVDAFKQFLSHCPFHPDNIDNVTYYGK